jgi:hypothetical protein
MSFRAAELFSREAMGLPFITAFHGDVTRVSFA